MSKKDLAIKDLMTKCSEENVKKQEECLYYKPKNEKNKKCKYFRDLGGGLWHCERIK